MRSSHGKGEYAPRDALRLLTIKKHNGVGQWDQTIYYHTHPPPFLANRASETPSEARRRGPVRALPKPVPPAEMQPGRPSRRSGAACSRPAAVVTWLPARRCSVRGPGSSPVVPRAAGAEADRSQAAPTACRRGPRAPPGGAGAPPRLRRPGRWATARRRAPSRLRLRRRDPSRPFPGPGAPRPRPGPPHRPVRRPPGATPPSKPRASAFRDGRSRSHSPPRPPPPSRRRPTGQGRATGARGAPPGKGVRALSAQLPWPRKGHARTASRTPTPLPVRPRRSGNPVPVRHRAPLSRTRARAAAGRRSRSGGRSRAPP